MWFRRIQPMKELYVEWFRNIHDIADYYWVAETTIRQRWVRNQAFIIYTKVPVPIKRNKRWRRRQKTHIRTYDILRYLHQRWAVDMYELWRRYLTHQLNKDKHWMLKIPAMSKPVRDKITSKLLPQVLDIIQEVGNWKDKKKAEGFYTLLEDEQITDSIEWPEPLSKQ